MDGVRVLITSTVLTWGGGCEILSVEVDGGAAALSSEQNIDVVSLNIGISVENNVEVQSNISTDFRGLGVGSTSGNIIKVLRCAFTPLDRRSGGAKTATVELHLDKALLGSNLLPVLKGDLESLG